jgi:hypothetical protein
MFDKTRGDIDAPPGAAESPSPPPTPAVLRFESCRWRRPAEGSTPAHCGHREVISLAGVHGFNPESWCEDCRFYKLRRTPRKNEYLG